ITKRYRKLARELHPDANPDDPEAEARFKEVATAYDVLGDDTKRKEYDEARRLGATMGGFGRAGGGPRGGPGGFTVNAEDLGDLSGLFGNLFNRGGGRSTQGRRGSGPQRGGDLEADLHLS